MLVICKQTMNGKHNLINRKKISTHSKNSILKKLKDIAIRKYVIEWVHERIKIKHAIQYNNQFFGDSVHICTMLEKKHDNIKIAQTNGSMKSTAFLNLETNR